MSVAPRAGAISNRAPATIPRIPPPAPVGSRHAYELASLPPTGALFDAWFPHEQPRRALDSWVIWCTGPCTHCHTAALGAVRTVCHDGTSFLSGAHGQGIVDRTRPTVRRGRR